MRKKLYHFLHHLTWEHYILAAGILIYTLLFSYLSITRFDTFPSSYDLANMDQTIWNTIHGRFLQLSGPNGPISRLSIHGDLALALISPIYFLWDDVRILLIFQSFFLSLGVLPIYFLAKKLLKSRYIAFLFCGIYLLNPGLQWKSLYDYHSVVLAVPLLLSAFYFLYSKKWKWFLIFSLLSMMTKEEIPLEVAIMGLLAIILYKRWRIGLTLFLLGLVWSLSMLLFIVPFFNDQHNYQYASWYSSFFHILATSPISQIPREIFIHYIDNHYAIDYILLLLKEFSFLPLLGLPWLILSSPDLTINIFSDHAQMRSILFQYDSGIIPGLMIASIFGVYSLKKTIGKIYRFKRYSYLTTACASSLAFLFVARVSYTHGPLPINPQCSCSMYHITTQDRAFAQVLEHIPEDASISASPEIRSHLTHRVNAYTIPYQTSNVEYIALTDQENLLGNTGRKTYEVFLSRQIVTNHTFNLIAHIGHYYLFKKVADSEGGPN